MIRAYPKDLPKAERTPDKLVVGWYAGINGKHYIVPSHAYVGIKDGHWSTSREDAGRLGLLYATGLYEIDISTAAEATGKLDKNGKEIFGSKGDMQEGDRIKADGRDNPICVNWDDTKAHWGLPKITPLGDWTSDELEIIEPVKPTEEKGK